MPKKPGQVRATRRTASTAGSGAAPSPTASRIGVRGATTVTLPSTEVQNEFGRVLDQASRDHDIIVTRHDIPRAVLVSAERYRELVGREAAVLDTLQEQFDALYARMQAPEVESGTARGFTATPAEMGQAALAAARPSDTSPALLPGDPAAPGRRTP